MFEGDGHSIEILEICAGKDASRGFCFCPKTMVSPGCQVPSIWSFGGFMVDDQRSTSGRRERVAHVIGPNARSRFCTWRIGCSMY